MFVEIMPKKTDLDPEGYGQVLFIAFCYIYLHDKPCQRNIAVLIYRLYRG